MIYEGKAITVTALESGIVELKFDLKGESVNKFNRLTLNELRAAVDAIKADADDDHSDHDMGGDIIPRLVSDGMAAVYDLRQVRKGNLEDPLLYGNDIVVVETSGSKSAFRRFIETVPAIGLFRWF